MPFPFLDDLIFLLRKCRKAKHRSHTVNLHVHICKYGLEKNQSIGNYLILMLVEVGCVQYAQQVFYQLKIQNECSWNSLINGYVNAGSPHQALTLYQRMQVDPTGHTFVAILKACARLQDLERGIEIHSEISRTELLKRNLLVGNALIDMYTKCDVLAKAHDVFYQLPVRDVVSWNTLIAGYVDCKLGVSWTALIKRYAEQGQGDEAVKCFDKMQHEGVLPDAVAYLSTLKACSKFGAKDKGEEIHTEIERQGLLETDFLVATTLVDMYSKCGSLKKAQQVFDNLEVQDVVSWNALLTGYNQVGEYGKVFYIFDKMLREGLTPDSVTFIVVLNACSRTGLWHKGETFFHAMNKYYGIMPIIDHYACMIDLLGRAGRLDKAEAMIKKLPICPNLVVWRTMLGACRSWGNIEYGKKVFQHVMHLDKKDG